MTVFMHYQDPLARPPHSVVFIVVLQALQTGGYTGVLLLTIATSLVSWSGRRLR